MIWENRSKQFKVAIKIAESELLKWLSMIENSEEDSIESDIRVFVQKINSAE